MGTESSNTGRFGSTIGLTVIFVLFFSIILGASLMGVFKGFEPYQQLIAAMLSVAATGVITALLLYFQRRQQEQLNKEQRAFQEELTTKQQKFEAEQKEKEKERLQETKVFEERLRIYQDFLEKLCNVVKDQKITPEEEIELQFQVAYITMHTSTKAINIISQQVSDIIVRIKNQDKNKNLLLKELFDIADTFKEELYNRDKDKTSTEEKSEDEIRIETESRDIAIENFSNIVKIDVKKYEKVMELKDRTRELKRMISNNGAIQRIYNGTVLFHEYFTTVESGKYVDSKDKIVIDLMPEEDKNQYVVLLCTRQYDVEKTKELVNEIWSNEKFNPWSTKDPHAHVHETIPFNESNEIIKNKIEKILQEVKDYRNRKYPLK